MYRGNHGNPRWYMGSMLAALTLWNTHTGTEQWTIYVHQWSTTKLLAFSADSTDVGTLGDCTYTRVHSTGFDPHRNLHSSTSNLVPRLSPSVERSILGSRHSNSAGQWVPILAWIQSSLVSMLVHGLGFNPTEWNELSGHKHWSLAVRKRVIANLTLRFCILQAIKNWRQRRVDWWCGTKYTYTQEQLLNYNIGLRFISSETRSVHTLPVMSLHVFTNPPPCIRQGRLGWASFSLVPRLPPPPLFWGESLGTRLG